MDALSQSTRGATIADRIAPHIPLLRRYARALTGAQSSGDAQVEALLEAILVDHGVIDAAAPPRVSLYAAFHRVSGGAAPIMWAADDAQAGGLSRLAPLARQALLLTALEDFSRADAARILGVSEQTVDTLVDGAVREVQTQMRASVLIVEDEPVIAMDIETVVERLGHTVLGVVDTRDAAVAAAKAMRPDLVLCDIQLADGSSGIDAAREIMAMLEAPVIFITAYPERLLTGSRPEPTYLITKPFRRQTLEAAIGQALFFSRRTAEV